MKYQGYSIDKITEKTLEPGGDSKKPPVDAISYKVSFGDKVVAVGLPDTEAAKRVVDTRRKLRSRMGLDPEG